MNIGQQITAGIKYFLDFYGLSGWISMDGDIHPNVPEADRKTIRQAGIACAILIVLLYLAVLVISVELHEAVDLT